MKQLVVLSGKGGTGKTTVTAALAHLASWEFSIVLADADVDAANLELVLPTSWVKPAATAEQLSRHYQVEPTFAVRGLRSAYPAIRGIEKLAHALRSAFARELAAYDVLYTRNLPVVCALLSCSDRPVVYETYRPWPRQAKSR